MKNALLLSVWGSPASTAYLKELLKISGLRIQVVYERNEKIFENIQRIYRERFGEQAPIFETADKILPAGAPSPLFVENLQGPETLEVISKLKPDWTLLAGSGILKEPILQIPREGTLNCHPGLLPRYRGCTCLEWAVYEDEPVGATCHFVTSEIDAGDIVKKEIMPVYRGQSYREIRLQMFYFCASLMAKSVNLLVTPPRKANGAFEKFDWEQARYYKPIPEEAMAQVLKKIETNSYRHLSERR